MGHESTRPHPFVLGLDIGVASLGWATIQTDSDGRAVRLIRSGVHLFEPGTDGGKSGLEGISQGKDVARNQQRRLARLMRRQTWRRARRKRSLLRLLQRHGLLPATENPLKRPLDIDEYLKTIDYGPAGPNGRRTQGGLFARWTSQGPSHTDEQRTPYLIRAAAVQRAVERFELGRAIYHLAQRRGFLSNRRTEAKKDEDTSVVKKAIGELAEKIAAHSPPFLGAYLASLDPDEQRLRGRWTARSMYEDEFDAIWQEQSKHHDLSDEARAEIRRAIFRQRPLKSQKHAIGRCTLIPDEPRAPIAHRAYQMFRVLQTVNNIEAAIPAQGWRPLTDDERQRLIDRLVHKGDATFAQARKVCGLPAGTTFNLEEGDRKKIEGHRSDAKLRAVFGRRFDDFTEEDKDRMVEDLRSFRDAAALARRAERKWGLKGESAAAFADISLEEGYASLSLAAMRALMPRLSEGVPYAAARRELFPASFKSGMALPELPPVLDAMMDLRNPAVLRALTEVRKVVNAIVRRYGKPTLIRVEIARDIKNPRAVRERITRENREREKIRERAKERILREAGIAQPSRDDIEKALLFDECGGYCPYTGRQIDFASLFGREPQFDIEHIWPRSRSLDDSFVNKTLCYHEENRARKRGRTPFEAYHGDTHAWEAMLDRVRRFKGDFRARREKLRRFQAEEIDPDFTNRHLSDTRYIARAAADYLGLLYGGRNEASADPDSPGTQRIETPTGQLTAWLRTGWGIDRLLGDRPEKNRADHRHHAIDAIVVALSDVRAVQTLARAATQADRLGKRRAFETIDAPEGWDRFRNDIEEAVAAIIVSHRQSRKVSGPLHQDTIYSRPIGPRSVHRVRKELFKLTPNEIAKGEIVDKRALAAIRAKLAELGKPEPTARDIQQIFGDPANAPVIKGHNGKAIRLRKVRVEADKPQRIGTGASARHIQPANNHHTVICAILDGAGKVRAWDDDPVTLLECYRRQASREPIVRRDLGVGRQFLFSLSPGDFVEMYDPDNATQRGIYRVASISKGDMELKFHTDARTSQELKAERARVRVSGDRLRRLNARKVHVTYLGEVRNAGG